MASTASTRSALSTKNRICRLQADNIENRPSASGPNPSSAGSLFSTNESSNPQSVEPEVITGTNDYSGSVQDSEDVSGCDRGELSCSDCNSETSECLAQNVHCTCEDCTNAATCKPYKSKEGYHAYHCWDTDCEQCKTRRPGVQVWDAREAPACGNPYTKGATTMA